MTTNDHDENNNDVNLSTYILQDDIDEQYLIQNNPIIQAFRHHSSNHHPRLVCDTYGLSGHPAYKYLWRGFDFLSRDIQRRISAYNTKYGNALANDTSQQDTQTQLLPVPEAKVPSDHSSNTHTSSSTTQVTIKKLQHVLPNNPKISSHTMMKILNSSIMDA